jgi:uncharacterized protein YgiM (DUF1202 family)
MNKMMLMILTLTLGTIACMTTATHLSTVTQVEPGGTFTIDEGDQVHCAEPICQLAPTKTAIPDPKAEPASGAVYEIPTPSRLCATVTAIQSLHLRAQPNERAEVIGYLRNGEQVRVITFGQWWKISTRAGTGYANAKYLQITECK